MTTQATAPSTEKKAHKRSLVGKVKSAKMQKTVVVEVVRSVRHPVYGKFVRIRKRYKAHDEKQEFREGDVIEIREHRPLSREKRWKAVRLVERPVQG